MTNDSLCIELSCHGALYHNKRIHEISRKKMYNLLKIWKKYFDNIMYEQVSAGDWLMIA